jgi:hypothetical protein
MESHKGVEYSETDKNGVLTKRVHKYSPGMLYARSFKLSDYPDAYWLIKATKCGARKDDAGPGPDSGPEYFYIPSLGAALSSDRVFDIEVRDGIMTNWTADIPGDTGAAELPEGMKRVNIYRI